MRAVVRPCRVGRSPGLVGKRGRGPVVAEQGPPEAGLSVEFVDRDAFDRDLAVEKTPVRREIGAVRQPGCGLEDVDLQHVAGAGTVDGDRAGEQMRSGPTVGDAAENVGDARVHQQVWGVAGVVGQGLDGHQVSRRDGQHGLQSRVEVAPVHGRRRGQPVDGGGGHG